MKLIEIELETKVIFKFIYNEKPYSMNVEIIGRNYQHIIVPAILEGGQLLSPNSITDTEIIVSSKDGIYEFQTIEIEASTLSDGTRVYLISSAEEADRVNRREAFRVFIGDIVKVKAVFVDGTKKEYEGILKNISFLGMCVILKQNLEVGTVLSILYNYEGLNMHLLGTVVRKEENNRYKAYSYGCQFKDKNNGVNRVIVLKQIKDNKLNNN